MRFYTKQHQYYCGIDLHARAMFLCILDQSGKIRFEKNIKSDPGEFLDAIEPFRSDIVVCVECLFTWYWLADLCANENIPFVLGHALYMKAIQGGKAKNDRISSRREPPWTYLYANIRKRSMEHWDGDIWTPTISLPRILSCLAWNLIKLWVSGLAFSCAFS
jgi:hypothetical protein